jgi:phage tail-like protein
MGLGGIGMRTDPFRNYNFLVMLVDSASSLMSVLSAIQRTALAGFSESSGLEMDLEVEEYKEGGGNGTILKFPTRVKWSNIRLRRGMAASDDLWSWHYNFVEGKGARRDGVIVLQDERHNPAKAWSFTRGLPVKWVGPSMNAAQSQVAIEELEITHEGLKLWSLGAAVSSLLG